MSTLDGKTIASTFKDLLQVSNNNVGVDETIRYIEDGEGTVTALAISTSMVELSGDLVPAQDVTFDIGSATHRFKDLYLSGNTIHLGDTTFSTSDLQALKDVQTIGVSNLPTFSEVATPAQGAKADSAIQPNDTRDLMPFSNMSQDIGSTANHWMHVYTHHLSAHGDVIVGGSIHGPATLTIDPAAVGDNTGKVVIAGDLQVDGDTTTVNSTELKVSDKTITVGDGATDATQVDGAGVEVAGSGATITYTSDNDSWNTNKTLIAPTLQSENTVTEQLNVTGNAVVDQMDLTAIEQVKNDQATAVFIYDTGKDSDSGAWRARTDHTSWYNEILNSDTRGTRREFPAIAVIVAETDKVTIYDGDDPELPMWMVIDGEWLTDGSIISLCMLNGDLYIGTPDKGLRFFKFIEDTLGRYSTGDLGIWGANIEERQSVADVTFTRDSESTIVNNTINDLDITTLPGSPVNPNTNLPVPTIAVATEGGVSVIKDDGTIVSKDSFITTYTSHNICRNIMFDGDEIIFTNWNNASQLTLTRYNLDLTHKIFEYTSYGNHAFGYDAKIPFKDHMRIYGGFDINSDTISLGTDAGLVNVAQNKQNPTDPLFCHVTNDYNTGWVTSDCKLITLCDTTAELVGLDDQQHLVLQDTFESDVTGWTQVDPASNPNSTFVWNDGHGMGIRAAGEGFRWSKPVATIPGVEYSVSFGMLSGSGVGYYVANSDDASSGDWEVIANNGAVISDTGTYNFVATQDITYIVLNTSQEDIYVHYDNLTIKQTNQLTRNWQFNPDISWQTDGWRLDVPGTWTMDNNVLEQVIPATSDGFRAAQQRFVLEPGQSYELSFDLKSIFSNGTAFLKINNGHVDTASDTDYILALRLDSTHSNSVNNLLPGEKITTTFTPTSANVTVGLVSNYDSNARVELIKNGSFDQSGYEGGARHWEAGNNWSIAGQGSATTNNFNAGGDRLDRALIQRGRLIPGQRYEISFVVDGFSDWEGDDLVVIYASGNDDDLVGGSGGANNYEIHTVTPATTVGSTVTSEFVASSTDLYIWTSASGSVSNIKNLTIDNVSVKASGGAIDNFSIKPTNNLITHGVFNHVDTSDTAFESYISNRWYGQDPDDNTYVFGRPEIVQRRLRLHNVGNYTGRLVQEIETEIGETYVFACDGYVGTTGGFALTKTDHKNGDLGSGSNSVSSETFTSDQRASITFVATAAKTYVRLSTGSNNSEHQYSEFDNITLHKAVKDRTINDKGLEIHGSLLTGPVAPGAEIVAYSDFSDDSYLVQPYNSDLDFGTDDFCFIGWIKTDSTGNQKIFTRDADSDNRFQIYSINGGVGLYTQDNGDRSYYVSNKIISDGEWHQFCCARRDGVLEVFVDGVKDTGSSQQGTINVPRNITAPGTASRVGNTHTYGIDPWDGAIAMLRVNKIVPTSDQIAKMYHDERQLFKPDSRVTLFDSNDSVTALHVDDHDQLHVGTSKGKSVFNGLTRVDHHDTQINNIIETSGDFTIER